jgi:hypothetical protein
MKVGEQKSILGMLTDKLHERKSMRFHPEETVRGVAQPAVDTATARGHQLKTAVGNLSNHFGEAANQTTQAVSERTTQITDAARSSISHHAEQVANLAGNLKNSVSNGWQSTGVRIGEWRHGMQEVFTQPFDVWLADHGNIAWAIAHPIPALGLLLLSLVMGFLLLQGFLRAIARLTEQAWFGLLQAPFKLVQWLLRLLVRPFQRSPMLAALAPTSATSKQERLTQLVKKLEAMRQEQDELLQEVKAILSLEE